MMPIQHPFCIELSPIYPYKWQTQTRARRDMADTSELYARGLKRRKTMFGEADVEKRMAASGEFGAPLQNVINAYVYGDVWERTGLSGADRSLVMLGDHRGQQPAGRIPRPCQGRSRQRLHARAGPGPAAAGRHVLRHSRRDRDQPDRRRGLRQGPRIGADRRNQGLIPDAAALYRRFPNHSFG